MAVYVSSGQEELYHYGIKRRSGRYPWGSGDSPYQRLQKKGASTPNDKIDKDDDVIISDKAHLYRLTKGKDDPSPNRKYFTVDEYDRQKYRAVWAQKLSESGKGVVESEYSINKEITIPSMTKRQKMTSELYDEDPKIRQGVKNVALVDQFKEFMDTYGYGTEFSKDPQKNKAAIYAIEELVVNNNIGENEDVVKFANRMLETLPKMKNVYGGGKIASDYIRKKIEDDLKNPVYKMHMVYKLAGGVTGGRYDDKDDISAYTTKQIQKKLAQYGYFATIDEYDAGGSFGNAPIIIFNPDSHVMRTKMHSISQHDIAKANQWLRKILDEDAMYLPNSGEELRKRTG